VAREHVTPITGQKEGGSDVPVHMVQRLEADVVDHQAVRIPRAGNGLQPLLAPVLIPNVSPLVVG
jgi:hypothetical protein